MGRACEWLGVGLSVGLMLTAVFSAAFPCDILSVAFIRARQRASPAPAFTGAST